MAHWKVPPAFEPKGHASVVVAPYWHDEHRLLFSLYRHLNMVVTTEHVEEAQQVATCHGIHNLVNARQQEWILWAGLVEIREVNAHSHSPVGLWDFHGVRLPRGVHHLSDHLGLLQLLYFSDDEILPILRLSTNLLLDGACLGAYS
jgi:hypothetical protein